MNKELLSKLKDIKHDRYFSLKECLERVDLKEYKIPIVLGKTKDGSIIVKDLEKIGNLLISGGTGTGKSIFHRTTISTLVLSKSSDEINFVYLEPKMGGELDIPVKHSLFKVAYTEKETLTVLTYCLAELEKRKNDSEYTKYPKLLIMIDEISDIMLNYDKWIQIIYRLLEEGNRYGIHFVISTSIPSTRVITPQLQENIKGRIGFALASELDSQIIIESPDAVTLTVNGDGIFRDLNTKETIRIQTPYIDFQDMDKIIEAYPFDEGDRIVGGSDYVDTEMKIRIDDADSELLDQIKELAKVHTKLTSTLVQRKLKIGYNKATRLLEEYNQKKS